jgi:hypothetical protein
VISTTTAGNGQAALPPGLEFVRSCADAPAAAFGSIESTDVHPGSEIRIDIASPEQAPLRGVGAYLFGCESNGAAVPVFLLGNLGSGEAPFESEPYDPDDELPAIGISTPADTFKLPADLASGSYLLCMSAWSGCFRVEVTT